MTDWSGGAWLVVSLAATSIAFLLLLLAKRELIGERMGRVLMLVAALPLPALAAIAATTVNLERSTGTAFCLSCHEMGPHGQSLRLDDEEVLAAVHTQNNLVPQKSACYACHADYTMYGTIEAKLNGMKHVYVHYLGVIPDKLALYKPYNTGNCLHCHEGSRRFEEQKKHHKKPDSLAAIKSKATSCLESGCHDVAHGLDLLGQVDLVDVPAIATGAKETSP